MTEQPTTPENSLEETPLFCAICQSQVTPSHKDDVNTQFYSCPKCGYVTKVKEPKELEILGISLVKLPDKPNPAKEAWKKQIEEEAKQEAEYQKHIKFIETELGPIDWRYDPGLDDRGHKKPFSACELRDILLIRQEYNIITDRNSKVIYLWTANTGIYTKHGEDCLRFLLDNVLGSESTTHKINEVIELVKIRTAATTEQSQKIAVLNGLLDIQTGNVEPFTPYEFNTVKLNVLYKEGEKSELWENFINQICPADKDLLQEWSGYLLIKGYPYHAIMWLFGPKGRNGKGAWARTMQGILGEDNYSAVQLKDLDGSNRFAVFNLHDSLFNICNEPRTDKHLSIELLQALTGQDSLDAERKGVQERFKLKNPAKITVMGNSFPSVVNPTEAFWERLKLIKFPFRFVGDDQIPDIEKQWLDVPEQRSGIFNWMIEGALKLINNKGRFTETRTQRAVIIQFKRASDSTGSFIMECLELNVKSITPKSDTYPAYKEYCEAIGVQPKSLNELNQKLEGLIGVKPTSIRIVKIKTKIWKGFSLKRLPEEPEEPEENPNPATPVQTQLPIESGTTGTSGTTFASPVNYSEIEKNKDNTQKLVPTVPTVPTSEKSALEEINLVNAKRFKSKAGVLCSHIDQDVPCVKEAEYSINENLYCPTDYEAEKENLRKIGKIVCAEWVAEVS